MIGPCSAQPDADGALATCSYIRTRATASDVVGSCRYCGWFACPFCGGAVEVAGLCAACAEDGETVETPTLTDAQLLALVSP